MGYEGANQGVPQRKPVTFSLGGGAPLDQNGLRISTPQAKPRTVGWTPEKGAAAATKVRTAAQEKIKAAWTAFGSELATLVDIWQSVTASREAMGKKNDPSFQARQKELEQSLQEAVAASSCDPTGAVAKLTEVLQRAQSDVSAGAGPILNEAINRAGQNVIKADQQAKMCQQLEHMCQVGPQQPLTKSSIHDIEKLMGQCDSGNKALTTRVRQVLGLEKDKEELAAQKAAQEALVNKIVAASGASADKAKKTLQNAGGNPDQAVALILSEKQAAAAKSEKEAKEKAEAKAKKELKKAQEKVAEAHKIASTISSLASSTISMAWSQMQIEFDTQQNVWQTPLALAAASKGRAVDCTHAQSELKSIMQEAKRDPKSAATRLVHAIQNARESGLQVCAGMDKCVEGVGGADKLAARRRKLATVLQEIAKAAEMRRPAQVSHEARELARMVDACQISDFTLAESAKKLMEPLLREKATVKL